MVRHDKVTTPTNIQYPANSTSKDRDGSLVDVGKPLGSYEEIANNQYCYNYQCHVCKITTFSVNAKQKERKNRLETIISLFYKIFNVFCFQFESYIIYYLAIYDVLFMYYF